MTTDDSKRDLWKEVQQKRKEKEEREWKLRHSVKQLKEDYPDLIPPSRYDEIFISQISETEFIVDDEDKGNYFEIYVLEPDIEGVRFDEIYYEDDIYHDEIGVKYVEEYSTIKRSSILEKVRNSEGWINFSQENRDWLVKQDEILTTIKEKSKREIPILYRELKGEGQKSPSGKGQVFVSRIEERIDEDDPDQIPYQRFIVDDENYHNHFSIWKQEGNIEWDLHRGIEYDHISSYNNSWRGIGIQDIYTSGTDKGIIETIGEWEWLVERLSGTYSGFFNFNWKLDSEENREWLERQKELFTSTKEGIERRKKLRREFIDEFKKREENGDELVLEYLSLEKELTGNVPRSENPIFAMWRDKVMEEDPDRGFPDGRLKISYDGSSFEKELERIIDQKRRDITDFKEWRKEQEMETEKPTPEQDS